MAGGRRAARPILRRSLLATEILGPHKETKAMNGRIATEAEWAAARYLGMDDGPPTKPVGDEPLADQDPGEAEPKDDDLDDLPEDDEGDYNLGEDDED